MDWFVEYFVKKMAKHVEEVLDPNHPSEIISFCEDADLEDIQKLLKHKIKPNREKHIKFGIKDIKEPIMKEIIKRVYRH